MGLFSRNRINRKKYSIRWDNSYKRTVRWFKSKTIKAEIIIRISMETEEDIRRITIAIITIIAIIIAIIIEEEAIRIIIIRTRSMRVVQII